MKILLVRLDHMGDVALTVPPVAASIRTSYPNAWIEVLTTTAGEALLQDDSNIDQLLAFDPPWSVPPEGYRSTPKSDFIRRCLIFLVYLARKGKRAGTFDQILFLSFSPWERFLTFWLGRNRTGFAGPYHRRAFRLSVRLLTKAFPFETNRHMLDNCLAMLQAVLPGGIPCLIPKLHVSSERLEFGKRKLAEIVPLGQTKILFHAGTHHSMKTWPFLNYLAVANGLQEKFGAAVIFVGTPKEIEQQRRYCLDAGANSPLFLATLTTNDLACVAANADLFIANDGGPMHIAAGLNVPTLAVFGPTDERLYGPKGSNARVVREQGICGRKHYPWAAAGCCIDTDKECLRLIKVDTVLQAAAQMMQLVPGAFNSGELPP